MREFKVGDKVRNIYKHYNIAAGTEMFIITDDGSEDGMRYFARPINGNPSYGLWWKDDNLILDVSYSNNQKLMEALDLSGDKLLPKDSHD